MPIAVNGHRDHDESRKPVKQRLIDPQDVLSQLSSEEKIALLSGDDMWHTVAVPRLGVPRVRMSDGPNGVRGTAWTNGAASSCFPCATGLGASFDVELAQRIGQALGRECRARGVHCLLGPTTNIQRHPCGGRGFESFGEDPMLSGTIAKAWIEGVESQSVMTTPKHFVANEQEFHRRSNDSVIDLRTLHEIYLEPFRIQMKANPTVFMSSYNRVNGLHVAEDPWLLRDILRKEFGFGNDNMIMSDWSGTLSSSDALKASLDLEMPGPTMVRGVCVERDIVGGKLKPEELDECVLRILNFVRRAQESGIPFEAEEGTIDTQEVRDLLREAADSSVVLLKNESQVLPVKPQSGMKIAVIGSNAKNPPYAGGGSANLLPTYTVTPLEAVERVAKEHGASVKWAMGADTARWTPLLTPFLNLPSGNSPEGLVVTADFYDRNPWEEDVGAPLFTKENNSAFTYFIDGIPKSVPVRGYVSLRTRFTPNESGLWELGLGVAGQADLYFDGNKLIDNSTDQKAGLLFFTTGAEERTARIEVEAGKSYDIEVRFSNFKPLSAQSPYTGRRGGIRIGGHRVRSFQDQIQEAVQLSNESDVTIVVIGTTTEWESEAYDRDNLDLPGTTNELVKSILASQPNAVIVNQSGMPVQLPWVCEASTVLQAFFGGNECGTAIADVIFGRVNPSGKLPVTWPVKLEDFPSHENFGNAVTTVYAEGLGVGYRYFDVPGRPRSEFPFGFGESYTTFSFSDLEIKPSGFGAEVSFDVKNTGDIAGACVGQVYVHQCRPTVDRPDIELGAFVKVNLEPGSKQRVSAKLDHKAFSYYDVRRKAWVGQRGSYEVRLGTSSRDIVLTGPFHVERSFTWTGLRDPELL